MNYYYAMNRSNESSNDIVPSIFSSHIDIFAGKLDYYHYPQQIIVYSLLQNRIYEDNLGNKYRSFTLFKSDMMNILDSHLNNKFDAITTENYVDQLKISHNLDIYSLMPIVFQMKSYDLYNDPST